MTPMRRTSIHRARRWALAGTLALGALMAATPAPLAAQGLFAPVVYVNDKPITQYELDQRMGFMQVLGGTGDPRQAALDALTEDRLYLNAARRRGIELTPAEIETGMAEFAARGGLDTPKFLELLAGNGVSAETFRDFVSAGLLWRKVVRQEFGDGRTVVDDRDVELATAPSAERPGLRALYSEIYLPARNEAERASSIRQAESIMARATSLPAFASLAREYSVAPTRGAGGRVNWVNMADLPPPLIEALRGVAPGEVAGPIVAGNVVALFQLRALDEAEATPPARVTLDYATYAIPGAADGTAQARAEALKGKVDTCDDLYGVAKGQPPEVLERVTQDLPQVPRDIALELAKLDEGEVSTALTGAGGQTLLFLMLCDRTHLSAAQLETAAAPAEGAADPTPATPGPDLAVVRDRIFNQRIQAKADGLLAELKAEAIIRQP